MSIMKVVPKIVEWDKLKVAPWDRLPGETDRAFGSFRIYRDIPMISRTYLKTANELGIGMMSVREQALRWHWRYRVELYDAYLDAIERQEQIDAIKSMNDRHARTAMLILSKVGQRLVGDDVNNVKAIDVNKLSATDLARLTEVAGKFERLARSAESDRVGHPHHRADRREDQLRHRADLPGRGRTGAAAGLR